MNVNVGRTTVDLDVVEHIYIVRQCCDSWGEAYCEEMFDNLNDACQYAEERATEDAWDKVISHAYDIVEFDLSCIIPKLIVFGRYYVENATFNVEWKYGSQLRD